MSASSRTRPAPAGRRPQLGAARWMLAALVGLLTGVLGLPAAAAPATASTARPGTASSHTAPSPRLQAGAVRQARDAAPVARALAVVAGSRLAPSGQSAYATVPTTATLAPPLARHLGLVAALVPAPESRAAGAVRPRAPPRSGSSRGH
ncbi:hypothetical protein [Motilibacter aurantiacus]|uniref:hypothetical protein n=1 Tax=Motilibacter aurantiacus TaxID=2714955 RepID=UPI00140A81FB|nr:hypothetical protein [Motilibacter aurantiacus]NHC46957.1 hypothetical protein [Motilibacter aurantiacus]